MRAAISLLLTAAFLVPPVPTAAATGEAQVKAAYIYKLASFVRWPPMPPGQSTFRLCVAGRSDVVPVLRGMVRNTQMSGRQITVEPITAAQASRAKSCQVLYLGRGAESARTLVAATEGLPVLTVGDRDNGTRGGIVDFLTRDGRVRFTVSPSRADARRLELSSKLMDVAVAVEP